MSFDYDFIIIGSGFGGSVSALRLSEKGYSVCVLEQGKRFHSQDFAKTNWDVRKYLWFPLFKCFGIQNLSLFKNVLVLSGTGVGGGSLVYANTSLEPHDEFYDSPNWKDLANWKAELAPFYQTARKMLGVTRNPRLTESDKILHECAKDIGCGESFQLTDVAVYFGEEGKTVSDPFFDGKGPDRTGCIHCGGCMVGCRHNSKNTLDKNYLYLAESLGTRVLPESKVEKITPIPASDKNSAPPIGYEIQVARSTAWFLKDRKVLRARNVIVSAGVLGTVDLLLRCKYIFKTLPKISEKLGHHVRTNSEALIGITEPIGSRSRDFTDGVAITSFIHPNNHTSIEPVRYPKRSSFMRLLAVPMVDGGGILLRPLKLLWTYLRHPLQALRVLLVRDWASSTIILLVMQTLDNRMKFQLGRNIFTLFRKRMTTLQEEGQHRVPAYIPIANQVGRAFAKKVGGVPQSSINEILLDIPTTAHILGGCGIGGSENTGVIDIHHQVFNYPGLYVCDGSAIPANLGVNPSLTITAMTERAMSRIEKKKI